jgi:hypothetical protein
MTLIRYPAERVQAATTRAQALDGQVAKPWFRQMAQDVKRGNPDASKTSLFAIASYSVQD